MINAIVLVLGWIWLISSIVFGIFIAVLLFAWMLDERIKRDTKEAMRKYG